MRNRPSTRPVVAGGVARLLDLAGDLAALGSSGAAQLAGARATDPESVVETRG